MYTTALTLFQNNILIKFRHILYFSVILLASCGGVSDTKNPDNNNPASTTVPDVTRIELVDSTLSTVQIIHEGSTVDLQTLPSRFNFVAVSSDSSNTGSIAFTLNDCGAVNRFENVAPYTLAEEGTGLSSLALGQCRITATPYEGTNKTGVSGNTLSVTFSIIDSVPTPTPTPPPSINECNDGVDNDGDGLVDWQYDVGCWGPEDATEAGRSRAEENGWTTFNLSADSQVIYVSASEGSDNNNGLTPSTAVATPERAADLVRDGYPDFMLLKRGDTWRDTSLGRFKSGRSASEPLVISSYGDSVARPRLELSTSFLHDNGQARRFVSVTGLRLVSYGKDPSDPDFDGISGGGIVYVSSGTSSNLLFEDLFFEYGTFTVQNSSNVELRRSTIWRHYRIGTCAYNSDGTPDLNGNINYRPSGLYAGENNQLTIEQNFFDENGWNPEVSEACATIYNHNLYLSSNKNTTVRDNIIMRGSSINLKLTANTGIHSSDNILIDNNLFVEGEIGVSIGGNTTTEYRFGNSVISNNIFSHIGRNPPTKREIAWYIDVMDNDNTEISNNLFLHSPEFSNSFFIHLRSNSNRDITINNNNFYGIYRRGIYSNTSANFNNNQVNNNSFTGTSTNSCLIENRNDFNAITFNNNRYNSNAAVNNWFCYDGGTHSLDDWKTDSGESNASINTAVASEPTRSLESYSQSLGFGASLDSISFELRKQSRLNYNADLDINVINEYIRAGYE